MTEKKIEPWVPGPGSYYKGAKAVVVPVSIIAKACSPIRSVTPGVGDYNIDRCKSEEKPNASLGISRS